jgi:hypothetical protein
MAQRQSAGRGLTLVIPPTKLAVDWGGTPFLARVP